MPMIIASIILGVLSATLVMLRINKREVEQMKDDDDEGGVIVDMFMVEDESILHQSHNN